MAELVSRLNRNKFFKFLSSVRLAVPLMCVLGVVVAAGTVIESRYNAQAASILVYRASWFWALLVLLWLNIFCAAVSRYPFKKHHTGFVITHIGLLTLLAGGFVTVMYGVDGQLRVVEGQKNHRVLLGNLSLKMIGEDGKTRNYPLPRVLSERTHSDLEGILPPESGLVLDHYLPFAVHQQGVASGGTGMGLSFRIQSAFFDVTESLHSVERPMLQMGPATIRLVSSAESRPANGPAKTLARRHEKSRAKVAPRLAHARASGGKESLEIVNADSGEVLKKIDLREFPKAGLALGKKTVILSHVFKSAVVASGKLAERGDGGPSNPALEIQVKDGATEVREIVFSKHPDFAMNPKGADGLRFRYVTPADESAESSPESPPGNPPESPMDQGQDAMPGESEPPAAAGNEIRFSPGPQPDTVRVQLSKGGSPVMDQVMRKGEEIVTPWMGMKLTLVSFQNGARIVDEVKPTEMRERSPLPPAAVFVRPRGADPDQGAWLMEGDFKGVQTPRGTYQLAFGPEEFELPFTVHLTKFTKKDYPGTNTAMSFESEVQINGQGSPIRIAMNEPLKRDGFTLYQASYEMGDGMETASIFSVNRDPGRPIKYAGSLILCLGIIIFTVMRSRLARQTAKGGGRAAMLAFAALFLSLVSAPRAQAADRSLYQDPGAAREKLVETSQPIRPALLELPVLSHGRVKPLDTYVRETILFLTGKYSFFGLDSYRLYMGLIVSDAAPFAELINVRDPDLRVELGFSKSKRYFSADELSATRLEMLARPIFERQEKGDNHLEPREKAISEAAQQLWVLRSIISGEHLLSALTLDPVAPGAPGHGEAMSASSEVQAKVRAYLGAVSQMDEAKADSLASSALEVAQAQPVPELFQRSLKTLGLEVKFNRLRPFFYAGLLYFLIGIGLLANTTGSILTRKRVIAIISVPMLLHIVGFAIRVYITGFAPVTNMYGTMVWMSFGVMVFGLILFALYQHRTIYGVLVCGAGLVLLLTESIPLVLSPDLDPIVAVLRSNYWLTIHVLTISISYAAFTIAMLIGNTVLLRTAVSPLLGGKLKEKLGPLSSQEIAQYSRITYRSIQLGVFLLTAGIILGGIWADYSWGRFWGWDPKETWALIADLGFLAILHGRFVGWVTPFSLLAFSPAAYLLVVMAWYGVNFILAAGLHSYGFSSGGALAVGIFVALQAVLFIVAWFTYSRTRVSERPATSPLPRE